MLISELGEFAFIDSFKEHFQQNLPEGFVGIGDDCAVIPHGSDEFLVSTDMLVENVHFITDKIGGYQLGIKSMAENLSDLAASGATPVSAFLSLGIPGGLSVGFLDDFMRGVAFMVDKYKCPLLGGDTTKSPNALVINVTVIGKTKKGHSKNRSSAKIGDTICVSGTLGDSAAGLSFLLGKNKADSAVEDYFVGRHHNPVPRVPEGIFLSDRPEVHAMMDISDGISSDLKHILKASGVSAIVELDKLPLSAEMQKEFGSQLSKVYDFALSGGEDYELLFTVDSSKFADLKRDIFNQTGTHITAIGKIVQGSAGDVNYIENSMPMGGFSQGFDHFAC